MGVIIGSATTVTMEGNIRDGFQSVSWSLDVQPNRMWQLGSWRPYRTQVTKTLSCNVTTYAGVLSPVNLSVATSCSNSTATKEIVIDANACSNVPPNIADFIPGAPMYITSYSYSKGDPTAFATESWSFQLWVHADPSSQLDPTHYIAVPAPSVVIQGITEGNYSGDFTDPQDMGVRPYTGVSPPGYSITGSQGQVSAGFPGIGNVDEIIYCLIDRIGGGVLGDGVNDNGQGKMGNSQATVQHSPLYINV